MAGGAVGKWRERREPSETAEGLQQAVGGPLPRRVAPLLLPLHCRSAVPFPSLPSPPLPTVPSPVLAFPPNPALISHLARRAVVAPVPAPSPFFLPHLAGFSAPFPSPLCSSPHLPCPPLLLASPSAFPAMRCAAVHARPASFDVTSTPCCEKVY